MAAEDLPFDLIARPDPRVHSPADQQQLLAQRRPPAFLSSHQQAALRYQPSDALLLAINSNEERRLPDAFLRRCIFHRIELTEELVTAARPT